MTARSFLITDEFIMQGISDRGGWSKEQLRLLGVKPYHCRDHWLFKGWKKTVIGSRISTEKAERFLGLKNAHLYITQTHNPPVPLRQPSCLDVEEETAPPPS